MVKRIIFFCTITILFSSCGTHSHLTQNVNNNNTNVVLSSNNYKIVQKVQGQATARTVFGIGNLKKLVANARANMLNRANLVGNSRAIINEYMEVNNTSILGFINTKTVTVSAYVIEFGDAVNSDISQVTNEFDYKNEFDFKEEQKTDIGQNINTRQYNLQSSKSLRNAGIVLFSSGMAFTFPLGLSCYYYNYYRTQRAGLVFIGIGSALTISGIVMWAVGQNGMNRIKFNQNGVSLFENDKVQLNLAVGGNSMGLKLNF